MGSGLNSEAPAGVWSKLSLLSVCTIKCTAHMQDNGSVSDIVGVCKEWWSNLIKPETRYSMSQVLGLKRLQELIQVGCWG